MSTVWGKEGRSVQRGRPTPVEACGSKLEMAAVQKPLVVFVVLVVLVVLAVLVVLVVLKVLVLLLVLVELLLLMILVVWVG